MDWAGTWDTIKNFFINNGWNILWFVVVLIFGILVIKIVMRMLKRFFSATKVEKIAQQFIMTIIKFCLWLVLILILLGMVGIEISGIITALSAVILAVGMALEDNISNLANGIVIVSAHMFKKGDYISVDGVEGSVDNINFLFTTIMTTDNKKVTIPNSTIVNNAVTNSGANKTRRVDFTFSVAYESDTELVKKIVLDVMQSNGKVYLKEGKMPFCRLKTLEESGINFFANCWCDREDYWDVYYYVMENVYNEFKKNGISIPYNQMEIRTRTDNVVMPFNSDPLPKRVEKQRIEEETAFEEMRQNYETRKEKRKKEKAQKKAEKKAEKKAKKSGTPAEIVQETDEKTE